MTDWTRRSSHQVAGLEAQLRDLTADGAQKIFREQLASVDARRAELEAALGYAREVPAVIGRFGRWV